LHVTQIRLMVDQFYEEPMGGAVVIFVIRQEILTIVARCGSGSRSMFVVVIDGGQTLRRPI
jgi:hypothetical protein